MMSKSLFRQALYVYLLNLQVDVGIIAEKESNSKSTSNCAATIQRYISYLQEDERRDIHVYFIAYGLVALDRAITALHYAIQKTKLRANILIEYNWTAHAAVQALIAERRKSTNIQRCWESASKFTNIEKYMNKKRVIAPWQYENIKRHRKKFQFDMYTIEIAYQSFICLHYIYKINNKSWKFNIILDELFKLSLQNSLHVLENSFYEKPDENKPLRRKMQHTLQLLQTEWALYIKTMRQKCNILKTNPRYNNKLYKRTKLSEVIVNKKILLKSWKVSFSYTGKTYIVLKENLTINAKILIVIYNQVVILQKIVEIQ